jgi:hypothetical protein
MKEPKKRTLNELRQVKTFGYKNPEKLNNKINHEEELNRLLELEKKWTNMFDSDQRVGLALLEEIRKLNLNDVQSD